VPTWNRKAVGDPKPSVDPATEPWGEVRREISDFRRTSYIRRGQDSQVLHVEAWGPSSRLNGRKVREKLRATCNLGKAEENRKKKFRQGSKKKKKQKMDGGGRLLFPKSKLEKEGAQNAPKKHRGIA